MTMVNGEVRRKTTINREMVQKGTPDRFLSYRVLLGAGLIGIAVNRHL